MKWTEVGTPAHSLAIFGDRVAALTPDRQRVFAREPATGGWEQIGGPASALIGGGFDLYALNPDAQKIYRFDGQDWTEVGGPAAQYVAICSSLYALNTARTKVSRFDPFTAKWTDIGGPADSLVAGGSKVYAISPAKAAIWAYSRFDNAWTKIGGPGLEWVGAGETVYGLPGDKHGVYRYNGTPESWTKIGGPADHLIGGGSTVMATTPGTGDLWRYRGTGDTWDKIGTPGTGFVSVGRTVFGMLKDKSAVWMGEDDDAETVRLWILLRACYERPEFGNRVTRGFLVKAMNGKVLAQHNAEVCFQPLSTLKLLPYLHALVEIDQGDTTVGSAVSWAQPTSGTTAHMTDASCLDPSAPGMTTGSAPLSDALPTMMWESHNRTLDAMLARFGTAAITRRAQSFGLRQTEMYSGCPVGGHPAPWANNVTTLVDLARMFEGVEGLDVVTKATTRQLFRENMIELSPAPGTSYSSPITKRTSGPWTNEKLRPLVEREAGAAKASVVSQFMQHVVLRGKGGGGGPSGIDVGGSDFLEVSLPFKQRGKIVIKKFLVGWYVCHWRDAADSIEAPESKALKDFTIEIHAEPIRRALATW